MIGTWKLYEADLILNDELFSTICSAREHLGSGSLFICDFWYGPAVLKQSPQERVKVVQDGKERIIRLVKPEIVFFLKQAAFRLEQFCPFAELIKQLSDAT